MKNTEENIAILKKLGFELDEYGYYSDKNGWGFYIECMPSFKTLLSRLVRHHYTEGYNDRFEGNKRKYKMTE